MPHPIQRNIHSNRHDQFDAQQTGIATFKTRSKGADDEVEIRRELAETKLALEKSEQQRQELTTAMAALVGETTSARFAIAIPGQAVVVTNKICHARRKAERAARRKGKRVSVYRLVLAGIAAPSARWHDTQA